MLDLNELERMLDEALQKETSESLKKWMLNRKAESLHCFVGEEYEFTSIESKCSEFVTSSIARKERYNSNLTNVQHPNDDLLIAA